MPLPYERGGHQEAGVEAPAEFNLQGIVTRREAGPKQRRDGRAHSVSSAILIALTS
jgi:hypothetical protein